MKPLYKIGDKVFYYRSCMPVTGVITRVELLTEYAHDSSQHVSYGELTRLYYEYYIQRAHEPGFDIRAEGSITGLDSGSAGKV